MLGCLSARRIACFVLVVSLPGLLGARAAVADEPLGGLHAPYQFDGFHHPVQNPRTLNLVRNPGAAVPMKFSLRRFHGMDIYTPAPGRSPDGRISPASAPVDCQTLEATGMPAFADGELSYDAASDTYSYVWMTERAWTGCRVFVLLLNDGNVHGAYFEFSTPVTVETEPVVTQAQVPDYLLLVPLIAIVVIGILALVANRFVQVEHSVDHFACHAFRGEVVDPRAGHTDSTVSDPCGTGLGHYPWNPSADILLVFLQADVKHKQCHLLRGEVTELTGVNHYPSSSDPCGVTWPYLL